MTENPKEYHPDFNEFWDELISKSEWAKDNAGKISVEFKNLGVLPSKPPPPQKQSAPPSDNIQTKSPPTTIDYLQKALMWLIIIIFSFLVATLLFNLATQPKRVYCALHQVTKGFLGQNCTTTLPISGDGVIQENSASERVAIPTCPNGVILNQETNTCESVVEPIVDPNSTTSNTEPEKNIQSIEKSELKASVIKSLLN